MLGAPHPEFSLRQAVWLGLAFAGFTVLLHVVANIISQREGYGIFRDEMYYLICGQRLAFGYVDQPPMVALQARLTQMLFGFDHMWSLRLFAALAGGAKVLLTGLLARALGGGRAAAALAMFTVLTVPVYLSLDSFLSMNAFDPVFWMAVVLALVELVRLPTGAAAARGWWVLLGVSAGLGLENKDTLVFYLVALLLGLLLTPARRVLASRWCAVGITLTVLLALPNLVWQIANHFPTWEWLQAVQHSDKDIKLGPLTLLWHQGLMLAPLHSLLGVVGLVWLFAARAGRPWRFVAAAYVLFLGCMMALHAKDYYLAPAYPVLFAAGAVACTTWAVQSSARRGVLWAYVALLVVGTGFMLPYALPILPPQRFLAYENWIGFHPEDAEVHDTTPLPQFYADRFGWDELLAKVSAIYNALPAAERAHTGFLCATMARRARLIYMGLG